MDGQSGRRLRWAWRMGMGGVLVLSAGCAGSSDALRQDVAALEERVAEMERSSGRFQVQMNNVEEDVLLLEDRVEAHRLSLERRGLMQARTRDELPAYEPPPAEPDYSYLSELPVQRLEPDGPTDDDVEPRRDERRREERTRQDDRAAMRDDSASEELVIDNSLVDQYAGQYGVTEMPPEEATLEVATETTPTPEPPDEAPLPERSSDTELALATTADADEDPTVLYQRSLDLLHAGEFAQARTQLEAFLSADPPADYQDNAYYWIGECYYAEGAYRDALAAFQQVLEQFPEGNKVPDSLLKIGLSYEQLDNRRRANEVLSDLVESYPATDAARRAEEHLSERN